MALQSCVSRQVIGSTNTYMYTVYVSLGYLTCIELIDQCMQLALILIIYQYSTLTYLVAYHQQQLAVYTVETSQQPFQSIHHIHTLLLLPVVLLYRFAGIQLSTANLRTTEYYLTYLRMTGHLVSSVFTHSSVCIIDIAIDSQQL